MSYSTASVHSWIASRGSGCPAACNGVFWLRVLHGSHGSPRGDGEFQTHGGCAVPVACVVTGRPGERRHREAFRPLRRYRRHRFAARLPIFGACTHQTAGRRPPGCSSPDPPWCCAAATAHPSRHLYQPRRSPHWSPHHPQPQACTPNLSSREKKGSRKTQRNFVVHWRGAPHGARARSNGHAAR